MSDNNFEDSPLWRITFEIPRWAGVKLRILSTFILLIIIGFFDGLFDGHWREDILDRIKKDE